MKPTDLINLGEGGEGGSNLNYYCSRFFFFSWQNRDQTEPSSVKQTHYTQPARKRHVNTDLGLKEKPVHRVYSRHSGLTVSSEAAGMEPVGSSIHCWLPKNTFKFEIIAFSLVGLCPRALNDEREQGAQRLSAPAVLRPLLRRPPAYSRVLPGFLHFIIRQFRAKQR